MATSDDGAPTPSPIPTGKGVRSAANEFLSRYLEEKSVQVPDLVLPEVRVEAVGLIPEEIDLAVMDTEAVVRSAQQTGAVRVKGHGIGREEMKAVVRDAERIFGPQLYCSFSEEMEKLRSKLEATAEEIVVYDQRDYRKKTSISMELKLISPRSSTANNYSFKGSSSTSSSANYRVTRCDSSGKVISLQDQLFLALIILSFYSFLFF